MDADDELFGKYWELLVVTNNPIIDEVFDHKFKNFDEKKEIQKWIFVKSYIDCLQTHCRDNDSLKKLIQNVEILKNNFFETNSN
jgi:hypothetical protein